jgi:hypothetical protein
VLLANTFVKSHSQAIHASICFPMRLQATKSRNPHEVEAKTHGPGLPLADSQVLTTSSRLVEREVRRSPVMNFQTHLSDFRVFINRKRLESVRWKGGAELLVLLSGKRTSIYACLPFLTTLPPGASRADPISYLCVAEPLRTRQIATRVRNSQFSSFLGSKLN